MTDHNANRTRKLQTISLLPRQWKALEYLTTEGGETNRSAAVRRLIEGEMRQRFGPDWPEVIDRLHESAERKQAVSA